MKIYMVFFPFNFAFIKSRFKTTLYNNFFSINSNYKNIVRKALYFKNKNVVFGKCSNHTKIFFLKKKRDFIEIVD